MNGLNGWSKIIFQLGLPAAMVFFFLFQQAGYIPSAVIEVDKKIEKHQTEQEAVNKQLIETLKGMGRAADEQTRIQRNTCLNTAKDGGERRECLR